MNQQLKICIARFSIYNGSRVYVSLFYEDDRNIRQIFKSWKHNYESIRNISYFYL